MISLPFPPDEHARLDALRTYAVLDTPAEKEFDDLARLAAKLCDAPVGLVSLVDAERQWFKARHGTELTGTARDYRSFCANAILCRETLQVADATLDPRFADSPLVQAEGVRFYVGVPLRNREDLALGTLCVLDRRPRVLTPPQLEGLQTIARQVMAQLELRRLASLGEFREKLIAILSHDLRTPLRASAQAVQHGLGASAPEHQLYLSQVSISAERMTRLFRDTLDFLQTRLGHGLSTSRGAVDLSKVCRAVIGELAFSHPSRRIDLEVRGEVTGEWDPDRLGQALSNLMSNALRYGAEGRPVLVKCAASPDVATLSVHNDGEPIAHDVVPRLFAPFCRGQASAEAVAGMGLGLYIVKEIATAHGGAVEVRSEVGYGTTFKLRLPRRPYAEGQGLPSLLRH
jgi:signal transduction histidine kinase